MRLLDTIHIAVGGLSTHKSRSALTILGIVIGITAIMLVMSLGASAQKLILGEIQNLGPKNVFILPGRQPTGFSGFASTILNDSLKQKDIDDLRKSTNVPDATHVVPIVFGPVVVTHEDSAFSGMLIGADDEYMRVVDLRVEEGVGITSDDVVEKASVVVVGKRIVEKLFEDPSMALGAKVKIKNKLFRIVGILENKGQGSFVNFDEAVIAPSSTAQQDVLGIRYYQRVLVEVNSVEAIPNVVKDVTTTLRENHSITDPDKDDFFIQTQADVVKSVSTVTSVMTVFLALVAAISLLVGGIGIMNIMLVSVTERTREIGLRKALGATNKNILLQFLFEAVILTMSGGIIGIALGSTLSFLITTIARTFGGVDFDFTFPVQGAILGIGVSTFVGLVFGIFPARQASQKSPMEALRYE